MSKGMSLIARWWCVVGWLTLASSAPAQLPPVCFTNVQDYAYMWWQNGWREGKVFAIQTSRYTLAFDHTTLALAHLAPLEHPLPEAEALVRTVHPGARPLFSDDFSSGTLAQALHGQPLNQALGGSIDAAWLAVGATYASVSNRPAVRANGPKCLVNQPLDPGATHRLEVRVKPAPGMDGPYVKFAGVTVRSDASDLSFWAASGLTLRIFGGANPSFDAFYHSTGNQRVWLAGGALNAATDREADGFFPVGLEFTGAGTAASPLQVKVFVNGQLKKTYTVSNLKGGPFAGFSGGYAPAYFQEFKLTPVREYGFGCAVEANGARFRTTGASPKGTDCHLVESGKFFQRRWIRGLTFAGGAPSMDVENTGVEVSAWPDRVSFALHARPVVNLAKGALELTLDLPARYAQLVTNGSALALSATDDSGFVLVPTPAGATLTVDRASGSCTVRHAVGSWPAGNERAVGVVVYPTTTTSTRLAEVAANQEAPLEVTARQIVPDTRDLAVTYDANRGWHEVALRSDTPAEGLSRIALSVANPTSTPQPLRLNFARAAAVAGITGITLVLGDTEFNPLGIPVQVSKNWHTAGLNRFKGPWYRGLTMLTVPPQTTIDFTLTQANAYWGRCGTNELPAASHAQLCLVGWGGHQLWDQAAIGAWGEQITFDPDVNLGRSMIDDVRPVHVWAMNRDTPVARDWCNNIGGGDFLVYHDTAGQKQWNSRLRAQYRRSSPKLTETTYAGSTQDRRIDLQCTVSVLPSDDYARIYYRLRYDVKAPVSFSRLAFFQLGADRYNDHAFNKMARGNANGLLEEWSPAKGTLSYSRTGIRCPGPMPWFSLHDSVSRDRSTFGAWANRGLVIRSWSARLGGTNVPTPFAAVYGTRDGGVNSANLELSPPPGLKQLLPGDYVEAELVQVTVPRLARDYYGPNAGLAAALAQGQNTWRIVHREAAGNNLAVSVGVGSLERAFPVRVKASVHGHAAFSIQGGLGYVPVTIAGLTDYRGPVLQRRVDGRWTTLDHSRFGKDFWQTDFDAASQSWEITYGLPLEGAGDSPLPAEFRFWLEPEPTPAGEVAAGPQLQIGHQADYHWLRWPSAAPFFRVLYLDSLTAGAVWQPLGIEPADDGTWNTIVLRDIPAGRLYRLSNE